jgi:hypothetical protein
MTTLSDFISREGVTLVHVWAPWCDNSLAEFGAWARFLDAHPDAPVAFVSIWADGDDGADVLRAHGLEGRVERLVVPGPKPEKADRRATLLGLPVSWIPTTWVFNRGGLLAYAFNYGEVTAEQLAEAVRDAARDW